LNGKRYRSSGGQRIDDASTVFLASGSVRNITASIIFLLLLCACAGPAFAQFGGPVAVRAEPVQRRAWEVTQPLVASVEPVTQTTLAAEQGGLVVQRMFDDGSRTKKDEVLVRMDTELLKLDRAAADAARQALEGALEQAKVRAENSRAEEQRLKGLTDARSAATGREYRDALTLARIDTTMVAVRTAELAQKKAELDRLDTQIRKSEVRDPRGDGVVAKRYVEVGQWVKQGDPVADVVWLDPVFVRANVPEYVIPKIKQGDPARVVFDALGAKEYTGTIEQIIPTADPASRTFPVKILLKNPDFVIRPGFFARATLLAKSDTPQFVVAKDAVVSTARGAHVVAARDGKAVVVAVKVLGSEAARSYVTGDLKDTDRVVTRGNESLRGGEPLMVEGDAPPAAGKEAPTGDEKKSK
jgi:RND family efflux transporter MFP subunit